MKTITGESLLSLAPFTALDQPCWRGTWHEFKSTNTVPTSHWPDIETRLRVDGQVSLAIGLQLTLESGRPFQLHPLVHDHKSDRESWVNVGVFSFSGELPTDENQVDAGEILRAVERHMPIAPIGGSRPGGPFADEPWIQYFPRHLIITQRGGLDV